jgi:hypothetical protein
MGLGRRIAEHFTLREARAAARLESDEVRAARRLLLARARRKLRAASVLRSADLPGEALVAARAALDLLARARSVGVPSVAGAPARAAEPASEAGLPDEFDEAGAAALRAALDDVARGLAELEPRTLSLPVLRARLAVRLALPVAFLLVAVAAVIFATRPRARLRAAASALYGPLYGPENVVDEDRGSEWLLPDAQTGYVDVFLGKPRDVRAVSVLNGHNAGFRDRATRGYTVELYREGQKLAEASGEFARLDVDADFVHVPVAARRVDRVRFVVRSFHHRGAAVAEIRVR